MLLALVSMAHAESPPLDLAATVDAALEANLELQASRRGTEAAEAVRRRVRTHFMPTLGTSYGYTRNYEEYRSALMGVTTPKNEYRLTASVTQPVFTGFATLNRYRLSGLDIERSRESEGRQRLDVIHRAKQVFFGLLKARKLAQVADEAVTLVEALASVARDFHEVGMTPLNDLLKAQVELANIRQERTVARNRLAEARADFNTLLRRPLGSPVALVDSETYRPFAEDLEASFAAALRSRPELRLADLDIAAAEKERELARAGYFPTVDLEGRWFKRGTEWDVDGGLGISDPEGWQVSALASWPFWQWGRTDHAVAEKERRADQARLRREALADAVRLEVQQAFLRVEEAEQNIHTIEAALAQARENYRISEARYREQMATATDVLDARTLLSRTETNYYTALYDYQLARASLDRAVGRERREP